MSTVEPCALWTVTAYATTVHRAQGMTVDTAHALIDPTTATRELLYVAMTRGATANHVYVAQPESEFGEPRVPVATALAGVLARTGAEQSATETMRLAADAHASLATLIKEYEAIAAHAVAIGAAAWPRTGGHSVLHLINTPSRRMPADYADALRQRERLIVAAATKTGEDAARRNEPWTRGLPEEARPTVAAYRARWGVTDPLRPLGRLPQDASRAQDRAQYVARLIIERHQEQEPDFGHRVRRESASREGISL